MVVCIDARERPSQLTDKPGLDVRSNFAWFRSAKLGIGIGQVVFAVLFFREHAERYLVQTRDVVGLQRILDGHLPVGLVRGLPGPGPLPGSTKRFQGVLIVGPKKFLEGRSLLRQAHPDEFTKDFCWKTPEVSILPVPGTKGPGVGNFAGTSITVIFPAMVLAGKPRITARGLDWSVDNVDERKH